MTKPVAILCATYGEVTPFWERMETRATRTIGKIEFREGVLDGEEVVVACAGVAKVNAAMATEALLGAFDVSAVINAGAAGAVSDEPSLFDIVVSEGIAHHDVEDWILVESYPFYPENVFHSGEALLDAAHRAAESSTMPYRFGLTVTGECFVDDSNREAIKEKFAPLAADMESAAMAQVCFCHDMPFAAVRCITDTPQASGFGTYAENAPKASELACDATIEVLHHM